MPDMDAPPDEAIRTWHLDGKEIEISSTDRFIAVQVHCNGDVVTTGYDSRRKMVVAYSGILAKLVTQENVTSSGVDPAHIEKVVCLSFRGDGSGLMDYAPIVYPQADQERTSCAPKHGVKV